MDRPGTAFQDSSYGIPRTKSPTAGCIFAPEKMRGSLRVDIIAGEYVAQSYAAPSTRGVLIDATPTELKLDVRLYTYGGAILQAAARLDQGQTTNMRTVGGGFAPLLEICTLSDSQ